MASAQQNQFVILDKAVASRFWELYNRPGGIYRQDVDEWRTDYQQLASFAERSNDPAVARGWAEEKPRYARSVEYLMSKVRTANPANYDTSIKVKGCADCDCGSKPTPIPTLSYTPMQIPGASGSPGVPGRSPTILSFGDGLRNMFSPTPLPFLPEPESLPKEVAKDTMTGVIVAIVVAIIFWGFHFLSKKRAN